MFGPNMYYIEPSNVQADLWNIKSVQGEVIWTDKPYDHCFYRIYGVYPDDIPQMIQAMQEKLDGLNS